MASTAFPLGTYVGNANGNDPVENAQFKFNLDRFSQIMGIRPTFMDTYTDNSAGDPSTWVGNAGWTAWSYAKTGSAYVGPGSGIVPVVGIPLSWSGESGSNVDAAFRDIASGKYDSAFKGIVDAWINDGYKSTQFRIGYEFNVGSIPWDVFHSTASTAGQDFVAAFQRIATIVHNEATSLGATAQVVWNPGGGTSGNTTQLYPGDQYVDVMSMDEVLIHVDLGFHRLVYWRHATGRRSNLGQQPGQPGAFLAIRQCQPAKSNTWSCFAGMVDAGCNRFCETAQQTAVALGNGCRKFQLQPSFVRTDRRP